MSEHKESLVKVLEYLVNDEQDKAADLLHNVFVEKAKNHWASITEDDEIVEDEISEEDLDETIDLDEADDDSEDEEVEEAINASDDEEDFLSDIETAEEEIEDEEIMDDEDMDDEEMAEPEMDLAISMDDEAEEAPDAEEAMDNVEDAIAELRAAFADLMGDEEAEEEPEMEESVEPMEEGATLTAVNVSHSDNSDKASPVASNAKAPNDAKAHATDTSEEKGGSAPAAKDMGVTGPQEAGDLSAAPAPKREMK
jgi:pilus assembly protein FimV